MQWRWSLTGAAPPRARSLHGRTAASPDQWLGRLPTPRAAIGIADNRLWGGKPHASADQRCWRCARTALALVHKHASRGAPTPGSGSREPAPTPSTRGASSSTRSRRRARLRLRDKLLWILARRFCAGWREHLSPETIVRWRRQGWLVFWRWKSRSRGRRPHLSPEVRDLIATMSRENRLRALSGSEASFSSWASWSGPPLAGSAAGSTKS